MIEQIDSVSWENTVNENKLSVFFNPNYLDAVSRAFDIKITYFNYKEKDVLLFLAAIFTKNNKIVIPDNFTYNPYYLNQSLSERKQIAVHKQFIVILKNRYKSINIKFNVDVLDIRPYKWAGFKVDVRYTYIKNTSEPSHINIQKNFKKAIKMDVLVQVRLPQDETINLNCTFLKKLNFSNSLITKYKKYLNYLSDKNLLMCFEIHKSNNLLGAALSLLDIKDKKAYTLLSNPITNQYSFAHTALYQTRINWLRDNDYSNVDFCGANFESISYFKSYFNPKLMPYYVVSYKKNNFAFLLSLKSFAKRIYKTLFTC